ncbi:alpha-keto acid decarboxylase family protein [Legionella cardiaca]|uniref:Alpha-keto acid decarboxylase family protein n=1 Tax=Legionella cardiaca TaxID=1071983 RepID=A0ABY8ARB1_9GAMM|nr:alpha-keto acid decarboxylase family protein [Legionella cardiaca]WED43063.1 alpha-keto acid decarboxylase family protein [Legionella cardiaca]
MMAKMTIGDYLLTRLTELNISDIFGVPGDYNLTFLDQIVNFPKLRWIGNCNELNAAYAADGYARVRGAAAIVTTFGVGELSAINGIAGSYAEYLPIVNIVGAPSTITQRQSAIMHHTFGTGDFKVFIKMFENLSAAVAILDSAEKAAELIDTALEKCWVKKQPVYISLPSDMVNVEIDAPKNPLNLKYPDSNPDSVAELVSRTAELIRAAKAPVILADLCASRHNMKELIHNFLEQTGIPFATMNMGKGIINESHPGFIGFYNGAYSTPGVQERVESSDCIVSFGTVLSDFNTGGFTCCIDANATVEIHSNYVKVRRSIYPDVYFNAVIPALTKDLEDYHYQGKINNPKKTSYQPQEGKITQKRFWNNMAHYFKPQDIILAETGTSMFGLLETTIPDNSIFIAQSLWGSIGYTVGALLGAALADRNRRTILFVGDGSFQLTAQEISTVLRQKLAPIVFLLNNDGYTIERVIHGPKMIYNDIQPWQYAQLPMIFGDNVFTAKVSTEAQLAEVLEQTEAQKDKMCFIEVMMDRDDCPENLRKLGKACEEKNKG